MISKSLSWFPQGHSEGTAQKHSLNILPELLQGNYNRTTVLESSTTWQLQNVQDVLLYKQWGGDKILKILKTINVPTNTDMTFKKSVKQSPPILIVETAGLPWNDADEWKDRC